MLTKLHLSTHTPGLEAHIDFMHTQNPCVQLLNHLSKKTLTSPRIIHKFHSGKLQILSTIQHD